ARGPAGGGPRAGGERGGGGALSSRARTPRGVEGVGGGGAPASERVQSEYKRRPSRRVLAGRAGRSACPTARRGDGQVSDSQVALTRRAASGYNSRRSGAHAPDNRRRLGRPRPMSLHFPPCLTRQEGVAMSLSARAASRLAAICGVLMFAGVAPAGPLVQTGPYDVTFGDGSKYRISGKVETGGVGFVYTYSVRLLNTDIAP